MPEPDRPATAGNLPLTGERTVPGIPHENYWFRRHEAVYVYVAPSLTGVRALEVGCGEGYGTALLSRYASHIVGLDYDAATVAHAARAYPAPTFTRGNLATLPFTAQTFDAVVTLQVIEHVWDHSQFLGECRRVLRPGGRLVVSTPNRLTFSPGREVPLNPFHTYEFVACELVELVERCGFTTRSCLGLHAAPDVQALDARWSGSFVGAQLAAAPESWPSALLDDVAGIGTDDFVISADDLDGSLDLVLLAVRTG